METPDDLTTPSKLQIQYGQSKFWVMVDSGSSTSIATEQMAKDIEARDINTWWSRTTNPLKLKSYTDTPIKTLGTLYCDIECNGWKAGRVDIIVVPDKHRAIVGRDLFEPLGIQLKQHDSPKSSGKNVNSIDTPQTPSIKEEVAIKYNNLTTRIGRSIHHKVKSQFKSNYTPVHQKGRRVPLHLETQVEELKNLQKNRHITKLEKCSDEFFISPIIITVKKEINKTSNGVENNQQINSQKQISDAQHRLPNGQHRTNHHSIVRRRRSPILNNRPTLRIQPITTR